MQAHVVTNISVVLRVRLPVRLFISNSTVAKVSSENYLSFFAVSYFAVIISFRQFRATCGDYFTAFLSDNGLVLTCGQGDFGCLGHGDWNTLSRPKLIDELLTLDIVSLNTGSHHLAVTTGEGDVYTWGCGFDGRLGHGDEEHL